MAITLIVSVISLCELAVAGAPWAGMGVGIGIAGAAVSGIRYCGIGVACGLPA
jgi:hypothetical protein